MGPWEYLEWRGTTYSDTEALKVPLTTKMAKMPLVNPGLTKNRTRWKSSQKNIFHGFTSNSSFTEIFGNFDQVDSESTLGKLQKP